jgi:hypothetical protein
LLWGLLIVGALKWHLSAFPLAEISKTIESKPATWWSLTFRNNISLGIHFYTRQLSIRKLAFMYVTRPQESIVRLMYEYV